MSPSSLIPTEGVAPRHCRNRLLSQKRRLSGSEGISALQTTGGQTPVIEIMTREVATVDQTSPLEPAMQILQRRQSPIIAVVDKDQKLVGSIDPQNLAEFFLIGSARELQRE